MTHSPFSKPSRRIVLAGLGAGLLATPALALSEAAAKTLVERAVTDINKVIASGKSEGAMIRDFEAIFARYGDVPTIAISALGPPARSASAAQRSAFTQAFTGYMARKYGKRFREFAGGRIEVKDTRQRSRLIEVRTLAYLPGQSPFNVTFLVSDRSGRDKFVNLLIEGVNLFQTEKVEIGAMLERRGGNVDALIQDLRSAG
ncbi:phospholipid-binding protein MlaC [Cognatishimia sp. MH4019]|uniref:MlaC/ttg2D family ABC transporter substrate-binding protein n=1 Tax=Cognatishimia sp. MH4019 TaxID=2854030 RepID=UPI001CD522CB|nr:ABC transporter substrate-binding protein [Cognatishimia sp. MH4019]